MAHELGIRVKKRLINERKTSDKEEGQQNSLCIPRTIEGVQAYKFWDIFIFGHKGTMYEGCIFHAEIEIPQKYSLEPPKMKFLTKIFHPNVYVSGKVCISILHTAQDDPTQYTPANLLWSPVHTIDSITMSVISILTDPNPDSPANIDASNALLADKEQFQKDARAIALKETEKARKALTTYNIEEKLIKREKVDDFLKYDLSNKELPKSDL